MQKLFLRSSLYFLPPICRTSSSVVAFPSTLPMPRQQQQHFRLFCSQMPAKSDDNSSETTKQCQTKGPSATASSYDPFGWEPTKRERFYFSETIKLIKQFQTKEPSETVSSFFDPPTQQQVNSLFDKAKEANTLSFQTTIIDEPVEEYYVIDEEEEVGVVVPMVAEKEPYLRDDLVKRPLNSLTVDELVEVLRDQRARNIAVIQQMSEDGDFNSNLFVIICSPFNLRHGKALYIILRAFLKRNFVITKPKQVPQRQAETPRWNVLNMAGIVVHILDEELRRMYDLESLILGLDCDENEDGTFNAAQWKNEYRVPEEMLIKAPSQWGRTKQLEQFN